MRKDIIVKGSIVIYMTAFLLLSQLAIAEDGSGIARISESTLEESLRSLLDENRKLKQEKTTHEDEVNKLSARTSVYIDRIKTLNDRVNDLREQMKQETATLQKERQVLREEIDELKQQNEWLKGRVRSFDEKMLRDEYYLNWKQAEEELEVLKNKIKQITVVQEGLIEENAKAHYNLGNLLFQKGAYKKSAYEYEQALRLMPDDADTCYNLALIYDYYLKDKEKASYYYSQYLQKSASAKSPLFVKERITDNDFEAYLKKRRY
jgi:tetratricopeptide (TPR) repeat protein